MKKLSFIYIFLAFSLFLILSIYVQNIPLFSDGSQHGGVIREIIGSGEYPLEDFQGTQRNNLNSAVSIRTPFLYYPSFYVFGSSLSLITGFDENTTLFCLNVIPILLSALLVFLIFKRVFNEYGGLIALTLFLFSNVWLWMVVHRLIEPVLIFLFLTIFYLILKINSFKLEHGILLTLLLVGLLLVKQSSFLIIIPLILMLFLKFKIKKSFLVILFLIVLFLPMAFFAISNTGSVGIQPPGIPFLDSHVLDPWWNNDSSEWEIYLDEISNKELLRKRTLGQFKEVQLSAKNLLNSRNYFGIIQEFFIHPIIPQGHQGYSPVSQNETFKPFLLLLLLFLISIPIYIQSLKDKKELKFFSLFLFLTILLVFFAWSFSSVFRYFLFVDALTLSFLIFPLLFIRRKSKYVFVLLLFLILIMLFFNLSSEIKRDLNYQYSVGHRSLPTKEGGLQETMELSQFLKESTKEKELIFSNIAELGYYSDRKLIWDDRLFFIDNQTTLLQFLKNYDFNYLVIPYYSGKFDKKEWVYYQGIPSDSLFNKLLKEGKVFIQIESYRAFTLYKKNQLKNEI
jgi:hypothetical protein